MATATITITLELPPYADTIHAGVLREGLEALADVMLVQAEDGLYTLGSPDACDLTDDDNNLVTPNAFLLQFTSTSVEVSA